MHPKTGVSRNSPRPSQVFVDNFYASFLKMQESQRLKESLRNSELEQSFDTFNDDEWLEEEAMKRGHPLTNCLSQKLQTLLQNNKDFTLSHCPNLTTQIAQEITRVSLNEPGGLTACRVKVDIVLNKDHTTPEDNKGVNCPTITLGNVNVSDNEVVETFEVQIYLFPSTSVLSWLQSMMTSLSLKRSSRPRRISLLTDFVLVKRKLFRSNSNNSLVVIKSVAN